MRTENDIIDGAWIDLSPRLVGGRAIATQKKSLRSALETEHHQVHQHFFLWLCVAALEEFKFLMEIQPAGARHMSAA